MTITQCPSCASRKIKHKRQDWEGEANGTSYKVRDLQFYECPSCGERIFDRDAMRKIEARSPVFAKSARVKRSA